MSAMKELRDAEGWHYRGEGAANIVLAYRGDDPELTGKVLRLRKVLNNDKSVGNVIKSAPVLSREEQTVWTEWPDLVSATTIAELNHAYARDVLRPLLGEEHVDPGTLVHIESSFIEALGCHIDSMRPTWRAESGSLEVLTGVGLLISDHTYFPTPAGTVEASSATISVELKPKCGFLPSTTFITEEDSIKKSLSRFTMHQQLKFHQGKIDHISKYDPLDLFSGTRDGILKAIEALFETPQNNLRIFLNGEEIFGASKNDKLSIIHFDNVLEGFVPAQAGERVQAFQNFVTDLLLKSDILHKLLAVQRLDYYDIEGAIQVYDRFLSYQNRLSESPKTDEISSTGKGTEELRQVWETISYRDECLQLSEKKTHASSASVEDCQNILRDFLISATAKDCGLMLSLQPLSQSMDSAGTQNANILRSSNGLYLQKILLLDLDLKRLKKMNYYSKLDREIVQAYKSVRS
ncbi:unnamed protein product [Calypogeia fissa]